LLFVSLFAYCELKFKLHKNTDNSMIAESVDQGTHFGQGLQVLGQAGEMHL
jgi:hypothetical protein